jgi:hypothetical protein
VSAGALALAGVPTDETDPDAADEAAETLASSTARVTDGAAGPPVHGTLAGLLAASAVRNATLDGSRFGPAAGFERAATERVGRALRRADTDDRVQVIARWEPFPGSTLDGRTVAGANPPPDADVHAAAFWVPSGLPAVGSSARSAARSDGFTGVAGAIARGVVRGLFPPNEAGAALRARSVRAESATGTYRSAADALGARATVERALRAGDASRANRLLTEALAAAIEPSLRERFDDPTAAARATAVGRVRITVRTWSR